mgnify:CR=1 FL=1
MEDIRLHLVDLLSEVTVFPSKDLLVSILSNKCIEIQDEELPNNEALQSILRASREIERKTGVSPLCISQGTYKHEIKGKDVETPIFLRNVEPYLTQSGSIRFDRVGELELNPYLKNLLLEKSSDTFKNIEELELSSRIDKEKLDNSKSYIGNFDPRRFAFIREIKSLTQEDINYSSALVEIYGNEVENNIKFQDKDKDLFPIDSAQSMVTQTINEQSILVQGPPGTGKSQVLSNFLGHTLNNKKTALVVSEKQSAIDILCAQLDAKRLMSLYFKLPSKNTNRAFIDSLKKSWDTIDNSKISYHKPCFKDLIKNRKKFNLIAKVAQEENCSTLNLIETIDLPASVKLENLPQSNVRFADLNAVKAAWEAIPTGNAHIIRHFRKPGIDLGFKLLKKEVLKSISVLSNLSQIKTWYDAKKYLEKSLSYHSFNSEPYTSYGKHLNNKGSFFLKNYNEYEKLKGKLNILKEQQLHWKNPPTYDELTILEKDFNQRKGVFTLILWRSKWRKYTRAPQLNPVEQIKKRKAYFKALNKLNKVQEKLYSVGFNDLEIELPIVSKLLKSTNLTSWSEFQKENTATKHRDIYYCLSGLKRYFKLADEDEPLKFLESFIHIEDFLFEYWSSIEEIPPSLLPFWNDDLSYFISTIKEALKRRIFLEHPSLDGYTKKKMFSETNLVNNKFDSEALQLSKNILHTWSTEFKRLETLTRKDPRKLSAEEKALRKKLKRGKSILTREFAKKRSHKPIRELLSSEARPWIDVLKPIWLGNPSLLADHLPMEKEMFDFVVSDESSQLLLSHSIGAFQRGKKSIICGDPQQMVPSSYFKKKQTIEMSLLQHAFYHLPKIFLSNHYRSKHPRLIAFSNANFYENRLKSFQDVNAIEDSIEHHFVPDGIFHERQNKKEAEAVAQKIENEIDTKSKIGIVAFSEVQLQLIHECLKSEIRVKLNKRIEEKSAFSHSLENVQGDECDLLLISMGYGFNKDGNFEMRFGPINIHGGHHRLNVLFSRARQKIHYFSSVELGDFTKSNNEGVQHLVKWFELMSQTNKPMPHHKYLKFEEIIRMSDGFDDLLSYTRVYQDRGYAIEI